MGRFLNSKKASLLFKDDAESTYFVDKTALLDELIPLIDPQTLISDTTAAKENLLGKSNKYICIIRPRRFGKSVMANMIAAYFGKGRNTRPIFDRLSVSSREWYHSHINQHNVIHIAFNSMPAECSSYRQYIHRITRQLLRDLIQAYPDVGIEEDETPWDALNDILEFNEEDTKFIFVLDEWDFIFHRDFITSKDRAEYIDYLSNLLKDQPYVELTYMTGILPIAKYSSGSELNMFLEYTMTSEERFCTFFGFSESEVDTLFDKYSSLTARPNISREDLRIWYNGYHTKGGTKVYNPRSIVAALTNNNLGNYWTSAGPYDEIFYYIKYNTAAVRDDLALMISGIPIQANVREYAAISTNLTTRDEIFSAMTVYGFLSYENGYVRIPNKELMDKFDDMLQKEPSLGYIHQLAQKSRQMLKATLENDIPTMLEILEFAHNTEIPLLAYNNETELTALVNLVYLAARDSYRVVREDKAGIGYVDFIFYPEVNRNADGIILELKVDHTPEEAIQQIKDRKYLLKFEDKFGEEYRYSGRILGVGIAYDRRTKTHQCKIEILRESV